ncbi:MAG: pyridoxal phosphate-dependent aminotransferase [Myxococcales bacterium]|nr:pyridoxal phosphate-dependent aminotransferase [Myxococcales bacterium]
MARFPDVSTAGTRVPASIFARLREHLARFPGDVIPLQIGDTHLAPPSGLAEVEWAAMTPADLYAYGSPNGCAPLVEAIADKARTANGIEITTAGVQIAVGATHALSCTVQAVCDPGDELILLTPHWPLIRGMALGFHVVPIEVSLAELAGAITPRTSAIYLATPNNPDGEMLSRAQLEAIVEIAVRHDLWLVSDEVYEDYGYDAAHVSLASIPGALERTVTVFSFAKSYAQAGLRVGYALGPEGLISTIKKLVNHSVYNVPVAMQRAALGALRAGGPFLREARASYVAARDRSRARLIAPAASPPGGAYLWVDFRGLTGDDCMPILERCAAHGVLLAPGSAFGERCGGFARLCYTGVTPARLDEGIDRINTVLAHL